MANTGFKWSAFTTLQNAVALTQGATVTATSDAVDLDGKAGCRITVQAAYSNHAKATAGLTVYLLGTRDGTEYQQILDLPYGVEGPFTQNATRDWPLPSLDVSQIRYFKVLLVWGNTTGSSVVTVTTRYATCDVPVAS